VAGTRQILLMGGEPGVGKTRLVAETARTVHAEGAVVLYGRCDEELGVPYGAFAEALGTYAASCSPEDLLRQAGALGGELVRLLPALASAVPGMPEVLQAEPETERYRLLEAVREFLAGMAADAPLLLVLDDLHWPTGPPWSC
jgi:predicted ATPase